MHLVEARVVREALDTVLRKWSKLRIVDVAVGLHYGYVMLEHGYMGLFFTHVWEKPGPLDTSLLGSSVSIAPRLLERLDTTLATRAAAWGIVTAATNAWLLEEGSVESGVDEATYLGLSRGSRVLMVGHIEPLAKKLVENGIEVLVVERMPVERDWRGERGYRVLPDTWVWSLDPSDFDAIIVTGSSLAHPGAAHAIAQRYSRVRLRVLLGPSAGIHPAICGGLGYTHVGGSLVPRENTGRISSMIRAGYGYRLFKRYVVKWFARCTGG